MISLDIEGVLILKIRILSRISVFLPIVAFLLVYSPFSTNAEQINNEITRVSDLPLSYQYSSAEMREIMATYRTEPVRRMDRDKAKIISVKNSAIIVHGALVLPPYYLEVEDNQVFLNGYQVYPEKSVPVRVPASARRNDAVASSPSFDSACFNMRMDITENIRKKCLESIKRFKNQKKREEWLRSQLVSSEYQITSILVTDNNYRILFHINECNISTRCVGSIETRERLTGRSRQDNNQLESFFLPIESIKPNRALFIGYNKSSITTNYNKVFEIEEILSANVPDQVKMYRLFREAGITNQMICNYLVANQSQFIRKMEGLEND